MTPARDDRFERPHAASRHFSRTLHISFDDSYVTVDSAVKQIIRRLAASVEPMLTLAPNGARKGYLSVIEAPAGLIIQGSDSASDESFSDAASASRALYHRLLKIFIDARLDLLWMHAGVVSLQGKAVALVAPSGHGKSTLVAELLRLGCAYLSDEIAPIDPIMKVVLPFPLVPYKRVPTELFRAGEAQQSRNKLRVDLAQAQMNRTAVALERIYFLCYSPNDGVTSKVDCSPGTAVLELLRNSLNPSESRDEEIQRLCALASCVNGAYLHYSRVAEAANRIFADWAISSHEAGPQRINP